MQVTTFKWSPDLVSDCVIEIVIDEFRLHSRNTTHKSVSVI